MIAEWRTYSVEDFIPFTSEVYFRLIERANEAQWPLHLLMFGGGLAIVALLLVDRGRIAGALLAAAWIWVGTSFLIQRYAELSWAGVYFGWAFCIQGVVLFTCGLADRFKGRSGFSVQMLPGFILIAYGLLVYPLLVRMGESDWAQSEMFGIHPDPTAVSTLGILLIAARGWNLWIASIIPVLWCLIGGLTLWVLEAPWATSLPLAAAVAMVSMIWKTVRRG